jgi:hypothetical protein
VPGDERIPYAGEHICDGISDHLDLPAGLLHARNVSFQGELAEADAAEGELADIGAGAPTQATAMTQSYCELLLLIERLFVKRFSGHNLAA